MTQCNVFDGRVHSAVGAGLAMRGFRAREVLCVYTTNCVEYVYSYFGTMAIGGVVTTCNPAFTARELAFQLNVNIHSIHPSLLLICQLSSSLVPYRIHVQNALYAVLMNLPQYVMQLPKKVLQQYKLYL
jgi:acyl-CoA synthetase (AMP-forming)/AMP-acid ligase II